MTYSFVWIVITMSIFSVLILIVINKNKEIENRNNLSS